MSFAAPNAIAPDRHRARTSFVLVALYLAAALHSLGFIFDDAYITFRYGQNLASGLGVTFNPGERVEGYTNFTWMLLSSLCSRVGVEPPLVLPLVGIACGVATIVMVQRAGRRLAPVGEHGERWGGASGAAVVAMTGAMAFYAVTGLETVLFTALSAAAALALVEDRPERFGVAAGLALLTRPEGALIAGVGGAWHLAGALRRGGSWRPLARCVVPIAVIVLPYLAWKLSYFGTIIPNTLHAKSPDRSAGLDYVTPVALASAGLFGIALASMRERRDVARLLLAVWPLWLAAAWWEGGDWMPSIRFLAPAVPFLAIAADRAIVAWLSTPRSHGHHLARKAAVALSLSVWALWNFNDLRAARDTLAVMESGNPALLRLATLLRAQGVSSAGLVDIGRVGYETRWRIFDLAGLVDPVIARTPGAHGQKHFPIAHLAARRPDVMILRSEGPPKVSVTDPSRLDLQTLWNVEGWVANARWFQDHYRYACMVPLAPGLNLALFERADRPPTPLERLRERSCVPAILASRRAEPSRP